MAAQRGTNFDYFHDFFGLLIFHLESTKGAKCGLFSTDNFIALELLPMYFPNFREISGINPENMQGYNLKEIGDG